MFSKLLVVFIALCAMLGSTPNAVQVSAQSATPEASALALPPTAEVGGASLAEWTARYWQWTYSFPREINPGADTSGERCGYGQSGPVFFLATADSSVERTCVVPSGVHLYVPLGQAECSTVEPSPFYGGTEEELRTCAVSAVDAAERELDMSTMKLTVDGQAVPNLLDYRTLTSLFTIVLPVNNALNSDQPTTESIGDGYQVILAPLSPGEHEVTITLPYPPFNLTTITYRLNVAAPFGVNPVTTPVAATSEIAESTVDVGGRSLHVACAGSSDGAPTVLLEPGGPSPDGGTSIVSALGPDLAEALGTRFCSYDRANTGQSDPDPTALRTFTNAASDLLAVLSSPDLSCPCVVVGESLGGGISLVALAQDASLFAGLVLLDSVYPGYIDTFIDLAPSDSPEARAVQELASGSDPEHFNLIESFRQITLPADVPTIPIAVVTHDADAPPPCQQNACSSTYPVTDLETAWQAGQVALADALNGQLIVATNTSHAIVDENPELVISVVSQVIAAVLDPSSWATPVASSSN